MERKTDKIEEFKSKILHLVVGYLLLSNSEITGKEGEK